MTFHSLQHATTPSLPKDPQILLLTFLPPCQPAQKLVCTLAELLTGFDLDALDRHGCVVWGMWSDGRLACFNEAWRTFAYKNNGEPAISEKWGLGQGQRALCARLAR